MSLCFRVLPGRLSSLVRSRRPLSKLDRYQLQNNTGSSAFLKQLLDTQRISARAPVTSKMPVPTINYMSHPDLPFGSLDTRIQWNKKPTGRRLCRYDDNERKSMMCWSQMHRLQRMQRLGVVSKTRKHVVPIGITLDNAAVFQMQGVVGNIKNNSFLDDHRTVVPMLEDPHSSLELNNKNILFMNDAPTVLKTNQQQSSSSSPSQDNGSKPSQEQLRNIFDCLGHDLPNFFRKVQNYAIYTQDIIFINNIRGVTTKGLLNYVKQLGLLKIFGHIKFTYIKFDIVKITMHTEDATVKVRWRIRGITSIQMIKILWKYKIWNINEAVKENADTWYDGFSTYFVNGDGKVYKHVADKMMPNQDVSEKEKLSIVSKLALFTGLKDELNTMLRSN